MLAVWGVGKASAYNRGHRRQAFAMDQAVDLTAKLPLSSKRPIMRATPLRRPPRGSACPLSRRGCLQPLPEHQVAARAALPGDDRRKKDSPTGMTKDTTVRPFRINVPGAALVDLRGCLAATRVARPGGCHG